MQEMSNSKRKPDSLKLLSLNVRGLGNFRKLRAIFTWCRKQKADLIFLQETRSTKEIESQWRKEWGSQISFSHGSRNARGAAVLIKRGLDIVIHNELLDSKGRFIILKSQVKDKNYFLVNVYGPNKDVDTILFYEKVSKLLKDMEPDADDNIITGGDFNCSLDPQKDTDFLHFLQIFFYRSFSTFFYRSFSTDLFLHSLQINFLHSLQIYRFSTNSLQILLR